MSAINLSAQIALAVKHVCNASNRVIGLLDATGNRLTEMGGWTTERTVVSQNKTLFCLRLLLLVRVAA